MGWDAYAFSEEGIDLDVFKSAHTEVIEIAGAVDGLLDDGALDCSACGRMIEKMTGASMLDANGWGAGTVRRLVEQIDFDFAFHEDVDWAY